LRKGDSGLRSYVRSHPAIGLVPGGLINLLYARVGGLGEESLAIQKFARISAAGGRKAWKSAILGEEAMNRRQYSAAVRDLREALQWPNSPAQQMLLADSLTTALEHEGDNGGALAVLEPFAGPHGDVLCLGVLRPLVLEHLARIYRRQGDTVRATELEERVKKLLKAADADYSLDAQLGVARANTDDARRRMDFGQN